MEVSCERSIVYIASYCISCHDMCNILAFNYEATS